MQRRVLPRVGPHSLAYAAVLAAALLAVIPAVQIARGWHGQRVAATRALRDKMLDAAQMVADAILAERGLEVTSALAPVHGSIARAGAPRLRLDELVARNAHDAPKAFRDDPSHGYFRFDLGAARPKAADVEATTALRGRPLLELVLDSMAPHLRAHPERLAGVQVGGLVVDGRVVAYAFTGERTLDGRALAVFGMTYSHALVERAIVGRLLARTPLLTSTFGGVDWDTGVRRVALDDAKPLRAAPRREDVRYNKLLLIEVTGFGGERVYRTPGHAAAEWDTPYAAEFALDSTYAVSVRVALPRARGDRLVAASASESSQRWLLAGITLLGVAFVVAVFVEVRRQRQLAEARRAFVSAISHELRTPLAHMAVLSETLLVGGASSPAQERRWLGAISREAHRLGRLVENVLLHTRGEQVGLPLHPAWVDLAELVEDVVASADAVARARGVRVHADVPRICDGYVDAGAARQILLNLVENAIKYGPEGQTVLVTVQSAEPGRDVLRLAVDDEGDGVPEAHRERVWSPFERIGDRGGATGGSGLGLSVVRDLVAAHGGRAWVTDAPGGGARFVVELPQPPEAA